MSKVQNKGQNAPSKKDVKNQRLVKQSVGTLYMLVRNVRMYDPDNEIFLQPLEDFKKTVNTIIAVTGMYELHAVGTIMYVNKKQVKLDFSSLENVRFLTEQFKDKDVGGFHVVRPVSLEEIKDFLWIFSPKNNQDPDEDGVDGKKLANIKVGKFAHIKELLDKMEDESIEEVRKVDRKKYAMTVYARAIYYMRTFIDKLRSGGQLPSMQPAERLIQDLVDICEENRNHFLGMTTTKSVDEYLYHHSVNTALICIVFGVELEMTKPQIHDLGMSALFHDIGIAEVDASILNKKGKLSQGERRLIDLYPLHTVKTLLKGRSLDETTLQRILSAYEAKIDYSKPVKDKQGKLKLITPKIPLGVFGRIINIAACYDSLTSSRPFREAYGPEIAMTLMVSDMKYKFDPWLLTIFMKVMRIQPVQVLSQATSTIQIG